jgi:hypothetical protein
MVTWQRPYAELSAVDIGAELDAKIHGVKSVF